MMRKMRKVVLGLALGVAAVVAGGLAVLQSIDFNQYKPEITAAVRDATGRDLAIQGDLALSFFPSISVRVDGVTFDNAAWTTSGKMATLERAEAEVSLLPLLTGAVVVERLRLKGLIVNLEVAADGRNNWTFASAAPSKPEQQADTSGTSLPAVQDVVIEDVRLQYTDLRSGGQPYRFELDRLTLHADHFDGPLDAEIRGALNDAVYLAKLRVGSLATVINGGENLALAMSADLLGIKAEVAGTVAKIQAGGAGLSGLNLDIRLEGAELSKTVRALKPLIPTLQGKDVPEIGLFRLSAKVAGDLKTLNISELDATVGRADQAQARARGSIANLASPERIDLALDLRTGDIRPLGALTGGALPNLPPATVSAKVTGKKAAYAISDLAARLGGSDLTGRADLNFSGTKPRIQVSLTGELLNVDELTAAATDPNAKATPKKDKLFPADPLPLDGLRAVDLSADLNIRHILANKISLRDAKVSAVIKEGRLTVSQLEAKVGSGVVDGRLSLDGGQPKALLDIAVSGSDIRLGQLLSEGGISQDVRGAPTRLDVKLNGKGGSVAEMMAGLNGRLLVEAGQGEVRNSAISWGGDLLTQLLGGKSSDFSKLSCAVVNFNIRNGVAKADQGIAIETAKVNVVGNGEINLGSEELRFAVKPSAKEGLGVNVTGALSDMVAIKGTLANPSVGVDAVGAAKNVARVGAAIATFGLSAIGEALAPTADDNPCATALGKKAAPKAAAQPTQKSPGDAPPPPSGSGDPLGGVTKGLDGALKGLFGGGK